MYQRPHTALCLKDAREINCVLFRVPSPNRSVLGVEEIIDDGVCVHSSKRVFQSLSLACHGKITAGVERAKRERTVLRPAA